MTGPQRLPPAEAVEVGLSVLARKLRAELVLGLLEEWASGRRSGRAMLEDFRAVTRGLTVDPTELSSPAQTALAAFVGSIEQAGYQGGAGSAAARQAAAGKPAWARLREIGRTRGRPVPEWEILEGLHALTAGGGTAPAAGQPLRVESVESAMDLADGLGLRWSLHEYLQTTRQKFGPSFRPGDPHLVAAMILRVDAARQLLKPGGFTIGILPGPPARTTPMDTVTMYALTAGVQQVLSDQLTTQVGLGLLAGLAGDDGRGRPASDIQRALSAGRAAVYAEHRQEVAQRARRRAEQLRAQRFPAASTALYGAGMLTGVGLTTASLIGATRSQLVTAIGLVITTLSAGASALRQWTGPESLIAPLRAWGAEVLAERADARAAAAVQRVFGPSATPPRLTSGAGSRRPGPGANVPPPGGRHRAGPPGRGSARAHM